MIRLVSSKLKEICALNMYEKSIKSHETECLNHLASIFSAKIIPEKNRPPCFYNYEKQLDIVKTNSEFMIATLEKRIPDGLVLIPNPYQKKSFIPPPDIFLFSIKNGLIDDYIGFECKASTNMHRPMWNDNMPKRFMSHKIVYIFTNITENYTTAFIGDAVIDYDNMMTGIADIKETFNEHCRSFNELNRGIFNVLGIELSYRFRFVQKKDLVNEREFICDRSIEILNDIDRGTSPATARYELRSLRSSDPI